MLDLQLGDQLKHINDPTQAEVIAVEGDDEIFFNSLACAAGQQAADLLQGLAQFHGQKVIAHQAADGFAREQVGGERFEQRVRQGMPVHDADRVAAAIQHGQGVEVGLATEGFQDQRSGGVLIHRRLLVEQGAEVAAFFAEGEVGIVLLGQHQACLLGRLFLRTAKQVALDQINAHLG